MRPRHGGGHNNLEATYTARSRPTTEILGRVAEYLRPYWTLAAATVGCAVLSLLFGFTFPKLTQFIIDGVIGDGRSDLLGPAIAGLFMAFLLRDVFNSMRIRVNNRLEQNVIYDMRRDVFAKLQRLPVNYFDHRASGDLMTRVIEDVNAVERVLIDGTEQGTVAFLSITGVAIVLFITNPALALVAMSPLPLLVLGALLYTLTAHKRYRRQRKASSAMFALLMDCLQGIRQIKVFGREQYEDSKFSNKAHTLRNSTLRIMRAWAFYSPGMSFIAALGTVLVLWIGGLKVINGSMSVGELVGFLFYLTFFYDPITKLHGLNQMLQAARAGGERVFDILDIPEERATSPESSPLQKPIRGEVVYENVSFGYTPENLVLHNISLKAEPGQMIALVGPTGAGKSTTLDLLLGFYEITHGRILIDGRDISRIELSSLRESISVVSQEPFLFNGSIEENIRFGRLDASREEVLAASIAANCHDFICRLPHGYETVAGERGIKLSVGEKQRISIARALLKNAPLLVLDEATASVDTATEKLIQEALERLIVNRTSFVIAHRLSTIIHADQILVLSNGRIIERGTHDQLISNKGLYAKLAQIQGSTMVEEKLAGLQSVNATH
ncbi:MAG: ABC transporter ATP-binding protein/permease [Verrucomicrobia bacterium]|nr:ABC transporter ATP-binding protein/permease [Verrucomicrobiota bacterium]MCF7708022.1 ABC transporter ATP-binding protein/permease [Verrucomicrobiota bacterium]